MFYCDSCAKKKAWPLTLFKSRGQCEMCDKVANCNSTPSDELP
jgi:hypothetical protein